MECKHFSLGLSRTTAFVRPRLNMFCTRNAILVLEKYVWESDDSDF